MRNAERQLAVSGRLVSAVQLLDQVFATEWRPSLRWLAPTLENGLSQQATPRRPTSIQSPNFEVQIPHAGSLPPWITSPGFFALASLTEANASLGEALYRLK